jgi:hypothetical protein
MTIIRGRLYFTQKQVRITYVGHGTVFPSQYWCRTCELQRATEHWSWMGLVLIQTPVPKKSGTVLPAVCATITCAGSIVSKRRGGKLGLRAVSYFSADRTATSFVTI